MEPSEVSTWDSAVTVLGFESFLIVLAVTGCLFSRRGVSERIGLLPGRLSSLKIAALVAGTLGLSAALDGILNVPDLRSHSALPELDAILAGARGGTLLLALLAFGLAPGVAEELLCRGFFQRGLASRLGPAAAIVISAGLFGALHIEPIHAVTAAILGVYLGSICWFADSVRPAILCHAVNNAFAVVGIAFDLNTPAWPAIPRGAAIALGALLWVARKAGPPLRAHEIRYLDASGKVGNPPTSPDS
jgi:membrane protease YdiL (CAAX protease family)